MTNPDPVPAPEPVFPPSLPRVDIYREQDNPEGTVVLIDGVRMHCLTGVETNMSARGFDTVTLTFAAHINLFNGTPPQGDPS